MNVGVVGTGYVGLVASVCFADAGHNVACVDSNKEKLKILQDGHTFVFMSRGLNLINLRKGKKMMGKKKK